MAQFRSNGLRLLAAVALATLSSGSPTQVMAQVLIGKGPAALNSAGNLSRIEDGFIGVPYGSRGELLQVSPQNTYAYTSELNFLGLSTNSQTGVRTTSVIGSGPDPEVYSILINAQTPGDAFTNLKIENFSRVRLADAVNITSSDLTTASATGKPAFTLDMPITRFLGEVEGGVSATVKTAYATTNLPASVYLDATGRKIRVDLDGGTSGSSTTPATGAYSLALYFVDPENRGINNTYVIPVNYFDRTKGPVLASTPGKDITLVPVEYGKLTACLSAYNTKAARIANIANNISLTLKSTANGVSTFCGDITQAMLEVGRNVYYNIYLTGDSSNAETVVSERVQYWGAPAASKGNIAGNGGTIARSLSAPFTLSLWPTLYSPSDKVLIEEFDAEGKSLKIISTYWDSTFQAYATAALSETKAGSYIFRIFYAETDSLGNITKRSNFLGQLQLNLS